MARRKAGSNTFTCFTGTKVQILTRAARAAAEHQRVGMVLQEAQALSFLALLVQKYKY